MQPGRRSQAPTAQTHNLILGGEKMAYVRKTIDRWDIMGNYGYGWECECSEYTYKEAIQRLKEYRENGSGCYRLEKHREKRGEIAE